MIVGRGWTVWQWESYLATVEDKRQRVRMVVGDASDAKRTRMLTDMLSGFFDGSTRRAIEFMRAFSGAILAIPNADSIDRIAVEFRVSSSIQRDPSQSNRQLTAARLGLDPKRVSEIARQARKDD